VRDADLVPSVRAAKPMSALADLRGLPPIVAQRRAAPGLADTAGRCPLSPGVKRTSRTSSAMSANGTNAKCRSHQAMSEFGGKAENICSVRVFRILTLNRHQRANFAVAQDTATMW